jgi:hypothetical protein
VEDMLLHPFIRGASPAAAQAVAAVTAGQQQLGELGGWWGLCGGDPAGRRPWRQPQRRRLQPEQLRWGLSGSARLTGRRTADPHPPLLVPRPAAVSPKSPGGGALAPSPPSAGPAGQSPRAAQVRVPPAPAAQPCRPHATPAQLPSSSPTEMRDVNPNLRGRAWLPGSARAQRWARCLACPALRPDRSPQPLPPPCPSLRSAGARRLGGIRASASLGRAAARVAQAKRHAGAGGGRQGRQGRGQPGARKRG